MLDIGERTPIESLPLDGRELHDNIDIKCELGNKRRGCKLGIDTWKLEPATLVDNDQHSRAEGQVCKRADERLGKGPQDGRGRLNHVDAVAYR